MLPAGHHSNWKVIVAIWQIGGVIERKKLKFKSTMSPTMPQVALHQLPLVSRVGRCMAEHRPVFTEWSSQGER
jgi:hypothetical protein